jgi:DNA-binding CsgD family transcriptional regulator/small-conductance mechanosensitive channel
MIQPLINLITPIAVFLFSLVASFGLRMIALGRIAKWAKGKKWPADSILYNAIQLPSAIFCLAISAYLGLLTSPISAEWKSITSDSLWTFFILAAMLATLNIIQGLVMFFGQRLNLPSAIPAIRNTLSIITVVVSVLIVLGVWGAPTSPLLLLIGAVSLLVLLALRDSGPDYIAALQLAIWEHIRVGESIKLQDGEKGAVTKLGWHNVEILTSDGDTIIIPNSRLTKQIVTKFKGSPEAVKETLEFFEKQTSSALCAAEQKAPCNDLAATLSRREMEIAELVSQGATNKELAKTLFITENTAKVHIKNILQKLELKNRQQIAVLAASHLNKDK